MWLVLATLCACAGKWCGIVKRLNIRIYCMTQVRVADQTQYSSVGRGKKGEVT